MRGGGGIVTDPETRAFYRLVRFVPPRVRDYVSTYDRYEAKGAFPSRWTAEEYRIARGLSAYDSEEGARRQWLEAPGGHRFIVRYRLSALEPRLYERTFKTPGHYTVFGGQEVLEPYLDRTYHVRL